MSEISRFELGDSIINTQTSEKGFVNKINDVFGACFIYMKGATRFIFPQGSHQDNFKNHRILLIEKEDNRSIEEKLLEFWQ